MSRVIHKSWHALAEGGAGAAPAAVALDFAGTFSEGAHEGTAFAGRIHYDPRAESSERHISFALYEEWPTPVVTMAVGGQVLTSHGAAVYDSVFDGTASHYDFVTMYGTGPFDGSRKPPSSNFTSPMRTARPSTEHTCPTRGNCALCL